MQYTYRQLTLGALPSYLCLYNYFIKHSLVLYLLHTYPFLRFGVDCASLVLRGWEIPLLVTKALDPLSVGEVVPSELDQLLLGPNYQVGCLHLSPTIGSMRTYYRCQLSDGCEHVNIITSQVNSKRLCT